MLPAVRQRSRWGDQAVTIEDAGRFAVLPAGRATSDASRYTIRGGGLPREWFQTEGKLKQLRLKPACILVAVIRAHAPIFAFPFFCMKA